MGQKRVVRNVLKSSVSIGDIAVNGVDLPPNKKIDLLKFTTTSKIAISQDVLTAIDRGWIVAYDLDSNLITDKETAKRYIMFGEYETATPSSGDAPVSGEIIRQDGKISAISLANGVMYNFFRDAQGISSITDGTYTWTFVRNDNGQIEAWIVT